MTRSQASIENSPPQNIRGHANNNFFFSVPYLVVARAYWPVLGGACPAGRVVSIQQVLVERTLALSDVREPDPLGLRRHVRQTGVHESRHRRTLAKRATFSAFSGATD